MIDLTEEIKSLYKQKIEWLDLKEEGEHDENLRYGLWNEQN